MSKPQHKIGERRILLVSRCAWTMVRFRKGLVRALVENGYKVDVAGIADGYENEILSLGASFHNLRVDKKGQNIWKDLRLVFGIRRLIRDVNPDLVHFFTIKPVIYGNIANGLFCRKPSVTTITGLGYTFTNGASFRLRMLSKILYRFALRFSNFLFFLNVDDVKTFDGADIIPKGMGIEILPGEGICLEDYSNEDIAANSKASRAKGEMVFLLASRLIKEKGIIEYLEAARALKLELGNRVRFVLAGPFDGGSPNAVSRARIEEAVKNGYVQYAGMVDDMKALFSTVDVVVLPTYYREGIPVVLLEASAMERSLIATVVPGCREVVQNGKNGFLVSPRSVGELVDRMRYFVDHPEKVPEMGRKAWEIVSVKFRQSKIVERVMRKYEDVLAGLHG